MNRLDKRSAIITGASSGMGLATAKLFLENGANVMIADLAPGKANNLIRSHPQQCRFVECDVRSPDALKSACTETADAFGGIDILYNNAGFIGMTDGIVSMTSGGWDDVFNGLLRGPALATHYALPWLKANRGCVINTASTAGIEIGWGTMAYSIAKHALIYLTKWTAAELAPLGVRVNAITPGLILTPLLLAANNIEPDAEDALSGSDEIAELASRFQPLHRAGRPEDVAKAALYLASDDAAFVTGTNLVLDGGKTLAQRHFWDPSATAPDTKLREAIARLKA